MKFELETTPEQLAALNWALRRLVYGRGIRRDRRLAAHAVLDQLPGAEGGKT
jgi:hypothetical protein